MTRKKTRTHYLVFKDYFILSNLSCLNNQYYCVLTLESTYSTFYHNHYMHNIVPIYHIKVLFCSQYLSYKLLIIVLLGD